MPDREPETALESLEMLNALAQSRNTKFSSQVLEHDVSQGREKTFIRLVNDFDSLIPNYWQYASECKPLNDLKCDESIQVTLD